jgi:S1-C subfamily serine protease
MSLLDIAIVIFILMALRNGYARGFSLSSLSYVGLVAGTAVGAYIAPFMQHALSLGTNSGPYLALAVLSVTALVGYSIGYSLGEPLRIRLMQSVEGGELDSWGGAAFSAIAVLATSWFLGLAFGRGPIPPVATAIQNSAILRGVDSVFPRPPGFLSGVEQIIAAVPYPRVFDAITNPDLPGPVTIDPAIANDPAVVAAAQEAVKIRSLGCGGAVYGSGFPVGRNYLISNAHVVAGTQNHRVLVPDGRSLAAQVVLFDPERDVSILYVPGLNLAPLARGDASRGTTGATIGYPGGGNEMVSPAAVRTAVAAVGRDIYGQSQVNREIYVLTADIHPGNSGGPMVDASGRAVGVVFANSTTNPSEGYALTNGEVAPDIQAGVGRTSPVDTSACAS